MRNRSWKIVVIGVIMVIIAALAVGCADKPDHVVMTLIHPDTEQEVSTQSKTITAQYDGTPKKFGVIIKRQNNNKVIKDADLNNKSISKHITMSLGVGNEALSGVEDWENGWPIERGYYRINICFNNDGQPWLNNNDPNFYSCEFSLYLEIV